MNDLTRLWKNAMPSKHRSDIDCSIKVMRMVTLAQAPRGSLDRPTVYNMKLGIYCIYSVRGYYGREVSMEATCR